MTEQELETGVASSSRFDADESDDADSDSNESESTNHSWVGLNPEFSDYRKLGAPQHTCSFSDFELAHQNNAIFVSFRKRLSNFLHEFLLSHDIPLPKPKGGQRRWRLQETDKVCLVIVFDL
jgi:hypothetical protein